MSVLILRSSVGIGGGGSSAIYSWDDLTPDFYVDPAKTSNGAGTLGDPYQPSQALAVGPHASRDRVILWLPGDFNVTTVNGDNRKYPAILPQSGASASRRVIHKAQYPGNTDPSFRTRIRRTSGAGVIFGFYLNSYAVWDGFMCDTKSGDPETVGAGGSGEVGQVGFWLSNNCKFIRCYLDSQGATFDDGDRNNIFGQECTDMEVGDCTFLNIGTQETDPSCFSNWTLLMWYDCDGMEVHHCDFSDGPTAIWCKGQHTPFPSTYPQVRDHNYHHNVFRGLGVGVRISSINTDVPADYLRVYQNIFYGNQFDVALTQPGSITEPSGVVVVNNTFANGATIDATSYSGSSPGLALIANVPASAFRDGHQIFRNNIFYNKQLGIFLLDDHVVYDECRWDYNLYNTLTNLCQKGEGGPTENFATWSGVGHTPQRDANGLTSSPGFVNGASNDFRLAGGSAALNAGTDYLDLLGGGTSAAINLGAYITSDMSDVFGPRLS